MSKEDEIPDLKARLKSAHPQNHTLETLSPTPRHPLH